MTFKIENFVFLVSEIVAIDETVENPECFWFNIYFKNGQHKQITFKFKSFKFKSLPYISNDTENTHEKKNKIATAN